MAFPQGRIKIMSHSRANLELIYSWPKTVGLLPVDPKIFLDLTIVWFTLDEHNIIPYQWNKDIIMEATKEWLKIPANCMLDATVKFYSFKLLASLMDLIWKNNFNVTLIREFQSTFQKAAADIESASITGFLKIAVVKPSTRPEILSFNDSIRKRVAQHFACHIMIIHRGRTNGLDVENYYALLNQNGGVEIKVMY